MIQRTKRTITSNLLIRWEKIVRVVESVSVALQNLTLPLSDRLGGGAKPSVARLSEMVGEERRFV